MRLLAPLVLVVLAACATPRAAPSGPVTAADLVGTWRTDSVWTVGFGPEGYVPDRVRFRFAFDAQGTARIAMEGAPTADAARSLRYRVAQDTLYFVGESEPAHLTLRGDSLWLVAEFWDDAEFAPGPVPEGASRVRLGTIHFRLLRLPDGP